MQNLLNSDQSPGGLMGLQIKLISAFDVKIIF
jgi:hypothetical protein